MDHLEAAPPALRARRRRDLRGLHVCHVLSTFGLGGMERVALDLAAGVRDLGGRATVVALGPEGPIAKELAACGVPYRALERGMGGYDVGLAWRLRGVLRSGAVDVVHTHNPQALLYGALAGKLAGAGVVHTKHGINPSTSLELAARRVAAQLVDTYVAVSSPTAIVALEKKEIDAARLRVIPNGIDLTRFTDDPAVRGEMRDALGIPRDAFVAGTVGRLAPEKDQATILSAAAPLLADGWRLLFVGHGPEEQALAAKAAALPNGKYVHFLGARSDVPRVLGAMDVFVLSSVTEGLPLALLEAMAAGLPILSTPVGGVPEVVTSGTSGFLFPVGDAAELRRLLEGMRGDPEGVRRMSIANRAFVRASYSRDVAVDRYLDAYLAARRAPPAARRAPRA